MSEAHQREENNAMDAAPAMRAGPDVRAELLAMALCISKSQSHTSLEGDYGSSRALCSRVEDQQQEERQRDQAADDRNKSTAKGAYGFIVEEFCTIIRSNPEIVVTLPTPLMAQAIRASFHVAAAYADALTSLQGQQKVGLDVLLNVVRHSCLFNDYTAMFFREKLESLYSSLY